MNRTMEWCDEGAYKCNNCGKIFKVCVLNDEASIVENICILCGVGGDRLIPIDEEDLENYI